MANNPAYYWLRVRWWPVRVGTEFEKGDHAANEATAMDLLDSALADDFAIALDLADWRLTNGTQARWPTQQAHPLTPSTPHVVEWLSDNGSAYIAKDTLDTATALGLRLYFTPLRSPESNGIAEAFVKTFKRDYASFIDAPPCGPKTKPR
jgi:transposase InsO family protein